MSDTKQPIIKYCGDSGEELKKVHENAALNVKRVQHFKQMDWYSDKAQGPYFISDSQEVKTTWRPVGI